MFAIERRPAAGWLALLGGGEFTFGDTVAADEAWLGRTPPGPVGFLPTASGSTDYGAHFADYLDATFEREVKIVPIYRPRDARRGKNLQRLEEVSAVYLGGGIADQLLDTLVDSPALEVLVRRMQVGGVVVAIAAAAQCTGMAVRDLRGGAVLPGLGWLKETVVETNFDPAHDRRLRQLLERPDVNKGLGIPGGSAVLFGPDRVETVGPVFTLAGPDDDFTFVDHTAEGERQ